MAITLTEKRVVTLKTHLNTLMHLKEPKIRHVAKVIGHIISALPASKYGTMHYRNLENEKNPSLKRKQGKL